MNLGIFANSTLCLPALQYLTQSGHQIQLILPSGSNPQHAETEHYAQLLNCPIEKWSQSELETNILSWIETNQLSAIFVKTFPFFFPTKLLAQCKIPFLNFHYAPLPQYRGAQPVFWVIKKGEKRGAVVVHQFTEKVDSGDILHEEIFELRASETFGTYHTKAVKQAVRATHQVL